MGVVKITFDGSNVSAKQDADINYHVTGLVPAGIIKGLGDYLKPQPQITISLSKADMFKSTAEEFMLRQTRPFIFRLIQPSMDMWLFRLTFLPIQYLLRRWKTHLPIQP